MLCPLLDPHEAIVVVALGKVLERPGCEHTEDLLVCRAFEDEIERGS
jgi:hypothetical protein